MKQSKTNFQLNTILSSFLVFVSRLFPILPNFSPLGSFGFFSNNLILFIANFLIFDLVKGGFYAGFIFTYLGFLSYYFFGKLANTQTKKFLLLPLASFSFFLISNFGVWLYWYTRTIEGLLTCYSLALPFYRNTLLGDLSFGWGFLLITNLLKLKKRLLNKLSLSN